MHSTEAVERFWAKVDRGGADACWPWTGCRNPGGYGSVRVKERGRWRNMGAHRVACILAHGVPRFPKAMARHSCHNPPCVNPAHLSWGTNDDNFWDSVKAGRHPWFPTRGLRTAGGNWAITIRETMDGLAENQQPLPGSALSAGERRAASRIGRPAKPETRATEGQARRYERSIDPEREGRLSRLEERARTLGAQGRISPWQERRFRPCSLWDDVEPLPAVLPAYLVPKTLPRTKPRTGIDLDAVRAAIEKTEAQERAAAARRAFLESLLATGEADVA